MEGKEGEEPKSGSDSCSFCGRNKRKASIVYNRSMSLPASLARPRPSATLFRSMSDISPPKSFRSLWGQISSPPPPETTHRVLSSPAPVPPASKISPEKKTMPSDKSDISSVSPPPPSTMSASPDPDRSLEIRGEKLRRLGEQLEELSRELEVTAPESAKVKIETNVCGEAQHEDNTSTGNEGRHEEVAIVRKGETMEISFTCSCSRHSMYVIRKTFP